MIKTLLSMLGVAIIPGVCLAQKIDNTPVESFALNRFLGTWYEIARFDHTFERGMELTTARYFLDEDGNLKIINSGVLNNKFKTSTGKAKFTDTPGLLRVSFFGPFYSDYRVLDITPDYQYALIGGKTGKHLWILSRLVKPDEKQIDRLLIEASARGYDVGNLIWIEH
ncbi:MAG: lipocalin family protein [Bacteroidaceae bacterium]|nr:lipocalin family protein [Bacteroidaceae bacterium]